MDRKKDIKLQEKLASVISQNAIQCKCSNKIPIHIFKRYEEYKICKWCGNRVYKDANEQKKYDFKQKLLKLS